MTQNVKKKRTEDSDSISARLSALRETRLGLSQREFAAAVGISQSVLSKWERGEHEPPPMALMKIGDLAADEKAWWYRKAGRDPESRPLAQSRSERDTAVDLDLLTFVISTIQGGLRKRGLQLPDLKFAEMIVLCYEFCHRTQTRDADIVERFLRVA